MRNEKRYQKIERTKKNIAGQVLPQLKEFSLTKHKNGPKMNNKRIAITLTRKSDQLMKKAKSACEQETTIEKAKIPSNIVFSCYFEIGVKKNHSTQPLTYWLHFLLLCDQNHSSNLTLKMIKRMNRSSKNISGRVPETTRRKQKNNPFEKLVPLKPLMRI